MYFWCVRRTDLEHTRTSDARPSFSGAGFICSGPFGGGVGSADKFLCLASLQQVPRVPQPRARLAVAFFTVVMCAAAFYEIYGTVERFDKFTGRLSG